MSDAWWDNTRPEQVGPGASTTDARPPEKKHDATDVERHTEARVPTATQTIENPGTYTVSPVSTWGSGRSADPFLAAHGTPAEARDNTPAEAEELRRHERKLIPPKPAQPPVVGDAAHEPRDTPKPENDEAPETPNEGDEEESAESRGWRDRLTDAREKAVAARTKVSETTSPVRKAATSAYRAVSPERGQSFSFLWACGAAVAISPQTFVATWDHLIAIFGAPQWRSGPEPMAWGFFHGPGVWFKTVLKTHWEAGTQSRVILLALVGVLPLLIAQISEKISADRIRKWVALLGYGFPVVFICSASYIPGSGFQTWTEVYVTALCTAAWWGFSVSRTLQPGIVQFLLRIPLASVLVGIVAYSPGAAF